MSQTNHIFTIDRLNALVKEHEDGFIRYIIELESDIKSMPTSITPCGYAEIARELKERVWKIEDLKRSIKKLSEC
jgi:hypothetical protein